MASLEESIRDRLGTDATLTGLVGDRIYPDSIPDYDTPRPWVFYTVTESAPTAELSADSVDVCVVEFDCVADTKAGVRSLAAAVRSRLHKYRGGQVGRALWIGDQAEDLDGGHLITVRFRVWGSSATIIPADSDSNARIVTGSGRIDLYPSGSGVSVWVTADGVLHGNGSGLTGFSAVAFSGSAADLTGTLPDAKLSANVPLLNAANLFLPSASGGVPITLRPNAADTAAQTLLRLRDAFGNDALLLQTLNNYGINIDYQGNECVFNSGGGAGQTTLNGQTLVDTIAKHGESGNAQMVVGYNGGVLFQFKGATNSGNTIIEALGSAAVATLLRLKAAASQSGDLFVMVDSSNATITAWKANGAWLPASMSDASAANGTVYYSTTAGKLVYKNSAGTVNNLY